MDTDMVNIEEHTLVPLQLKRVSSGLEVIMGSGATTPLSIQVMMDPMGQNWLDNKYTIGIIWFQSGLICINKQLPLLHQMTLPMTSLKPMSLSKTLFLLKTLEKMEPSD